MSTAGPCSARCRADLPVTRARPAGGRMAGWTRWCWGTASASSPAPACTSHPSVTRRAGRAGTPERWARH